MFNEELYLGMIEVGIRIWIEIVVGIGIGRMCRSVNFRPAIFLFPTIALGTTLARYAGWQR